MSPKRAEIPYIYMYLYLKLKERARGPLIRNSYALEVLRRHFLRIPKFMQTHILSQMEEYGLIKRISRRNIRILDVPICEKRLKKLEGFAFW